ncbi:hypothetical protein GGX14DRAFT_560120 [Mycena pura]|uniref:Uncharacterized protein n=1 Tax=Mycena pura TaxID=153505 RepID=A0AAD6VR06_9AGAR|nr:hypothetical protein GGX14DRAFT_560120 [Mycena pura]
MSVRGPIFDTPCRRRLAMPRAGLFSTPLPCDAPAAPPAHAPLSLHGLVPMPAALQRPAPDALHRRLAPPAHAPLSVHGLVFDAPRRRCSATPRAGFRRHHRLMPHTVARLTQCVLWFSSSLPGKPHRNSCTLQSTTLSPYQLTNINLLFFL